MTKDDAQGRNFFGVSWTQPPNTEQQAALVADWDASAGGMMADGVPQQGDIVTFNDHDAVVMGVSEDLGHLTVQPLDPPVPLSFTTSGHPAYLPIVPIPLMRSPARWPPSPHTPPRVAIPATLPTALIPKSQTWYDNHSLALAKLMQLYKGQHSEPLHEIPTPALGHLTAFAKIYADAKESGLFSDWDDLHLGQPNPFAFLEQEHEHTPLPERRPKRIILRRRPT